MCVPHLYRSISFIIERECNELVKSGFHLSKKRGKKKEAKWTTFHGGTEMTKANNISQTEGVLH